MQLQGGVIEAAARKVVAKLALMPAGEQVRVIVVRSGLSVIARRLQATASANGMTGEIHGDLLRSLKSDC